MPLEAYAGDYTHAGYGTLVVEYKDGKLHVDATDRTWRFKMSLEHVSGEFFAAEKFEPILMARTELELSSDWVLMAYPEPWEWGLWRRWLTK